jgi:hypothetical protein
VNASVKQETTLVIRNIPPFSSVVFLSAGNVDDHLQIVEEDRSERAGAVGDELGSSQNSGFVSKVLTNASVGNKGALRKNPPQRLARPSPWKRIPFRTGR